MSLLTKTIKTLAAVSMAATFLYSTTVAAATMPSTVYDSGELVGLTNVNVEGYGLFDVSFNSQFQGNYYGQDFVLKAGAAGISLIGEGGLFDDLDFDLDPGKTRGCGTVMGSCDWFVAAVPFGSFVAGGVLRNWGGNNDSLDQLIMSPTFILPEQQDGLTYLDWTPSQISQVPVPAAALMFAPALLGFLGLRRRVKS